MKKDLQIEVRPKDVLFAPCGNRKHWEDVIWWGECRLCHKGIARFKKTQAEILCAPREKTNKVASVLMDEPDREENDNEVAPRGLEPLFGEDDIEESGEKSQTESEAYRLAH